MSVSKYDIIEYNGEKHTIIEWCAIKGLSINTLKNRLHRGMNVERALNKPGGGRAVKRSFPCLSCEWWKALSTNHDITGCACHLYLETYRHNGMNKDRTKCSTWEPRTGNSKKQQRPV